VSAAEPSRTIAVIRDLVLAMLVVCLIPLGILLVGAPLALFVRLLLEAARLVFR